MGKCKVISLALVVSIMLTMLQAFAVSADYETPAFPSAEGYARYTNGFRGGRVIEVTNLNDSGEGSLRWALEEESGPRIVVFKVGGIIELESAINIDGEHDDVYIAGQTAPGDGITLINYPLNCVNSGHVVIRFIRVRIGDASGAQSDGMLLYGCDQIVVDHCSVSWAVGYGFVSKPCNNISVQNCIFAESLYDSIARGEWGREKRSYGTMISGNTVSFSDNLLINNANKNLMLAAYYTDEGFKGKADIRNNVVYNWYDGNAYGDIELVQFEGNLFKKGEASITDTFFSLKRNDKNVTVNQKVYLSGNKLMDNAGQVIMNSDADSQWNYVENTLENYNMEDAKSSEVLFETYNNTLSADEAYQNVVDNAGATLPKRDYIDSRYIDELVGGKSTYKGSKSGLAGIIDSQSDVGGYPDETNFKGGNTPLDTDHDGMSDEWELLHGLNPEDYSDACQITLSDEGYTNIELYINELAGDDVKYKAVPTNSPEVPNTLIGDVNADEAINAEDALLVLKHAAKIEILSDDIIEQANLNEDNAIDALDALEVLKIAAKITE